MLVHGKKVTDRAWCPKRIPAEEVVAYLISKAGYRLLTDPQDDLHDLALMSNGLQVRGRGGYHQADVLGEFLWAPAFGNPIRLFIEAKWRGDGRVGIPEVRHAVGILQDVNQALVTVKSRSQAVALGSNGEDIASSGRGFCYTYRYALCSTSGFSTAAQAYALAHQVALIDLSHSDYDELRHRIDLVGDDLLAYIEGADGHMRGDRPPTRNRLVKNIRSTLRRELWPHLAFKNRDDQIQTMLRPLLEATRDISELFVGVSATGFVMSPGTTDTLHAATAASGRERRSNWRSERECRTREVETVKAGMIATG
jgi:hypothetical protein